MSLLLPDMYLLWMDGATYLFLYPDTHVTFVFCIGATFIELFLFETMDHAALATKHKVCVDLWSSSQSCHLRLVTLYKPSRAEEL